MEQTKALNALEPFLALTKSATSPRAAADLIHRATSAPNTYIFTPLLLTPNILSLTSSSEHVNSLTLLQIFSYGTYSTYVSTPSLPALNPAQLLKLRQLTFVTLARNPGNLSYENLVKEMGLQGPREVEDVVISAIYAGLATATLDPYHALVSVSSVSPLRDLQPNSIPAMLATLNAWSMRCGSSLADLEKQIVGIKAVAGKRAMEEKEWEKEVERLVEGKKEENEKKEGGSGVLGALGRKLGGGGGGKKVVEERESDEMDVDEEKGSGKSLKRGFGLLASGK